MRWSPIPREGSQVSEGIRVCEKLCDRLSIVILPLRDLAIVKWIILLN